MYSPFSNQLNYNSRTPKLGSNPLNFDVNTQSSRPSARLITNETQFTTNSKPITQGYNSLRDSQISGQGIPKLMNHQNDSRSFFNNNLQNESNVNRQSQPQIDVRNSLNRQSLISSTVKFDPRAQTSQNFFGDYQPKIVNSIPDQSNIYEQYKRLEAEIEKKKKRVTELNQSIKNVRFSEDLSQIQRLQNDIKKTKEDINNQRLKNKKTEDSNAELVSKLKLLEVELTKAENQQMKQDLLSKPLKVLQSELSQVISEQNNLTSTIEQKELALKQEIDNEFRIKTESKLLELCLKEAGESHNEKIVALYKSIKDKMANKEVNTY